MYIILNLHLLIGDVQLEQHLGDRDHVQGEVFHKAYVWVYDVRQNTS